MSTQKNKYYVEGLQENLGLSKQGVYDRMSRLNIEPIKEKAYITKEDFERMLNYKPSKLGRPKKEVLKKSINR